MSPKAERMYASYKRLEYFYSKMCQCRECREVGYNSKVEAMMVKIANMPIKM